MEIGSGARVRTFRGRRYFYFWHHERAAGRSVRREDSVGRVDSERAGQELLRRMAAYHRRAEEEFARRRRTLERLVPAAMHTSTWRYTRLGPAVVRAVCPSPRPREGARPGENAYPHAVS